MKEAALQAACRLNVGNLLETGRSTGSASPAAMAASETMVVTTSIFVVRPAYIGKQPFNGLSRRTAISRLAKLTLSKFCWRRFSPEELLLKGERPDRQRVLPRRFLGHGVCRILKVRSQWHLTLRRTTCRAIPS